MRCLHEIYVCYGALHHEIEEDVVYFRGGRKLITRLTDKQPRMFDPSLDEIGIGVLDSRIT